MNINWRVRLKNPVFWAQVVVTIAAPILAGLGLQWEDMTTWAAFGDALRRAVMNPVIVVSVVVSLWGIINDPTTKGLSDSTQAMFYDKPKEETK